MRKIAKKRIKNNKKLKFNIDKISFCDIMASIKGGEYEFI